MNGLEDLQEFLHYCPITGNFFWWPKKRSSQEKPVGWMTPNGYLRIDFKGKKYYAHRLAWFLMYGYFPVFDVDHINGCRTDNRRVNLREVTRSINLQNQTRARSNSSSGLLGVFHSGKSYYSRIKVDGRQVYLGSFKTPEEAHAAYVAAKRRLHRGCTI